MNSRSFILIGVVLALCAACSSESERSNYYKSGEEARPLVDEQYRLSADRHQLDEMRSQIPAQKQAANDELAFMDGLFGRPDRDPQSIREHFDNAMQKKREKMHEGLTKEREVFTEKERKTRDKFLKDLADERKEYLRTKHPKEERDDFYSKQDERRREFFENQREKRNDFESDVSERRKNFDEYYREKNSEFTQRWRAYKRTYDDAQKEKEKEKEKKEAERERQHLHQDASSQPTTIAPAAVPADPDMREFDSIPSQPGNALESGQ